MRTTPYGASEVVGYGAAAFAAAITLFYVSPWAALAPVATWCGMLAFFRDPDRTPQGGEGDLVAPADGRVTDVVDAPHPFVGEEARRIGIFLSVFDVHVNRAPAAGRVEHLLYKPGAFLDARKARASRVNESHELGLVTPDGAHLLVRQISGAIARRIVCAARLGQTLTGGERFGMIKFGSRTELSFDPVCYEAIVKPGDIVRGGETLVARVRARAGSLKAAGGREAPR